jgi:hypothetical protein
MKTNKEILAMTSGERRETVVEWATQLLAALPASELDSKIQVQRIGAEFGEWMVCRTCLEKMRDFPHMVYAMESAPLAPTADAQWLQNPGLLS